MSAGIPFRLHTAQTNKLAQPVCYLRDEPQDEKTHQALATGPAAVHEAYSSEDMVVTEGDS